jgi:hypothetical protein
MLDCVACTEAKMMTSPYGPSEKCFTHVGELTHVDLWGKYDKASIYGNLYYLLLVDNASCFVTVKFLKSKTQAMQKIKDYMSYLLACSKSPCAIQMDCGLEFVNEDLCSWCHSKGIRFQMTAPYSPSQNGIAKCMNRTLGELSCTILIASKLPEFLWEPAIAHVAYVCNMSFTKYIPDAIPYQLWHERRPNVAHLCEFGVPVWVLQQGQRVLQKMLPKSQCQAYVRYNKGSKSIKYYDASTRNILTLRNYRFLIPSSSSPPKEIAIEPLEVEDPQLEGGMDGDNSRTSEQTSEWPDVDLELTQKTRGVHVDYWYLNDPFPDEEEAGIAYIDREEALNADADDECHSLQQAKASPE